jgi:zinc D-Ala-D-Ala carboxypeptidase
MRTEHFSEDELKCRHCGKEGMDTRFMEMVEALRVEVNFPMIVTSAYRCPEHDASIGGKGNHPKGRAIDILIHGAKAFVLVKKALEIGFTGIGLRQSGPRDVRFVHLDNFKQSEHAHRPRIWTY